MKKLLTTFAFALLFICACSVGGHAQVAVTQDTGYIHISGGGGDTYINKLKVSVQSQGNNVIIRWDSNHFIQFPYSSFTTPSGGSAIIVANKIALYLN